MRIGIITLSASDNCGSLLQTYALKIALRNYGDVDVINFSSKESHAMYDVPRYKGLKRIKYRKRIRDLSKASLDYSFFRQDYIGISGKEYFIEDLKEISHIYDVVVVGSDQVWNVQMRDFSEAFFLGWTDVKKVAYAPSLGGRHLKLGSNFEQIRKWVNDFSFLSVREELGKQCLEEVTDKDVTKVLDPTLVIDENEWNRIVGEPLIEEDYIFYYSWAYCEDSTSKIVSDTAKRLGLPVYVIDPRKWFYRDPNKLGFTLFESSGPYAFLNLMKYAKMCYVESFHGMVFAYIFRKNYWLLDTHENIAELDSRLKEFVSFLGADDRVLTKYNVCEVNQEKPVEYGENETLEELKAKSWEYLDKAFKEV